MSKFSQLEDQSMVIEATLQDCMDADIVIEGFIDTIKKGASDFWKTIRKLIDMLLDKINNWRRSRKQAERKKQYDVYAKQKEENLEERRKEERYVKCKFYFLHDATSIGRIMLLLETICRQLIKYTSAKKSMLKDEREEAQNYIKDRFSDLKQLLSGYESLSEYKFDSADINKIKSSDTIPWKITSNCESILEELRSKILSVDVTFDGSGRLKHKTLTDEDMAYNAFLQEMLTNYITLLNDLIKKAEHDEKELDYVRQVSIDLEYYK